MRIIVPLTILTLVGLVFVCPASAAQLINLLPLGDSITAGGYYVAPLLAELVRNGYGPTVIANEGHSGYTIADLNAGIATYLNHPNVNAANTYILLMIGTNDMAQKLAPSDAASRLGQLLSDIRADAPLAKVIVAQIPPANHYNAYADAAVPLFNEDIVPVVHGFGPPISLVDMYTPFMPDPLPYMLGPGNVHPNQAGGNLMATVWYNGIRAVPEPSTASFLTTSLIGLLAYAWRKRK